jgi:hypothetical protein
MIKRESEFLTKKKFREISEIKRIKGSDPFTGDTGIYLIISGKAPYACGELPWKASCG